MHVRTVCPGSPHLKHVAAAGAQRGAPPLVGGPGEEAGFCMVVGFFRLDGVHGALAVGPLGVDMALTDARTALAGPPSGICPTPGCADCPV